MKLPLSIRRPLKSDMQDKHYEPKDKAFLKLKQEVFQRDKFACIYCGWVDKNNMIDHLNDEHDDNDIDNLACCCAICHSVKHMAYASQNNTGILIYCPTISQENLNRFMRISFVIQKIGTKEQKDFSLRIWNALKQNSQIVKNVWTSFKPQDIAENLVLLPNEIYDSRGENFFREIRILFTPKSVFIAPMIDYWCKIFNKPNPKQWEQLLPNIMV